MRTPENSIPLRISVFFVVSISLAALLREEYWPLRLSIEAFLGVAAGSLLSWLFRYKQTFWLRAILGISMLWVGFHGIYQIVSTPYDPRVPLANLLIKLLALHSFDMPARKDLSYSLLVSFILMALAAVFSVDSSFGLFLIFYTVMVIFVSFIISYEESRTRAQNPSLTSFPKFFWLFTGAAVLFLIPLTAASLFLFLFFPRIQGYTLRITPISVHLPSFSLFHGRVANPDYPVFPGPQTSLFILKRDYGKFNPDSYFGFNPYLDLRLRGRLSNQVVMKVKSQEPGYWRGMAYDHYTGEGWTVSFRKAKQLTLYDNSLQVTYPGGGYPHSRTAIQTYYVTAALPNLIFSIYEPTTIYFPSSTLYQNVGNAISAPFYLSPGTEYTVISHVPTHLVQLLRNSNPGYLPYLRYLHLHKTYLSLSKADFPHTPQQIGESFYQNEKNLYSRKGTVLYYGGAPARFYAMAVKMSKLPSFVYLKYYHLQKYDLQLPKELPQKVRNLAAAITENHKTMLGKIMAILGYLHQFPYTLNIPPPAPGEDAVSQFLFHLKKGYCEQFASAFAVLARCVGIPTRLATGYATGTYNPFTMEYVVREKDAHAWDEVYFPHIGWIPFDSSPAYNMMPSYQKRGIFIGLRTVLNYFKSLIKRSVSRKTLQRGEQWLELAAAVLLAGIILFLFFFIQKLNLHFQWKGFRKFSKKSAAVSKKRFFNLYQKLEKFLTMKGYHRSISETPYELAEKIKENDLKARVWDILRIYSKVRFSSDPVEEEEIRKMNDLLGELRQKK